MPKLANPIYFAGQPGNSFGWGICNRHLAQELSQITPLKPMDPTSPEWQSQDLPGCVFTPLLDHNLDPLTPARGLRNYGYTFFENELTERSVRNAQRLDIVFAGCSWCRDRLAEKGIHNSTVLIQGVDPNLFKVEAAPTRDRGFVIFSGGKFELRKGQDLVLRAFQLLHQKYPDMLLVNAWFNQWEASLHTMANSPHIRFELSRGSWLDQMNHLYQINGIDPRRVATLPLTAQEQMPQVYHQTDVGLFPNRCEGGTNLVMMEYMACGKPVIGSYTSGHCDILTEKNSLPLKSLRPLHLHDGARQIVARWAEPSLDEMIEHIEYAYHHRDALRPLAIRAALDMRELTWSKSAQTILDIIARNTGRG